MTFLTSAVELHAMMEDLKSVTLGNAILKGFKRCVLELNNPAAIKANQVVVMAPLESGFISGLSVSKFSLGRQAETGEKLQGAVNGCVANLGICLNNLGINLGEVLMAGRIQEDIEDFFALPGRLQPFFIDLCFKETILHRPPSVLKMNFNFTLTDPLRSVNAEIDLAHSQFFACVHLGLSKPLFEAS
jgi:hypothetical protein